MDTLNALLPILKLNDYDLREKTPIPKVQETAPYHIDKSSGSCTIKDYEALPENTRAELIDGNLIFMEAPSVQHQSILGELFFQIRQYLHDKKGSCHVYLSPIAVQLTCDAHSILEPDLLIVCDPKKITDRRILGAPDLIIEVVSPSSRKRDYIIKLNKYWTAGVKEYWIVDPDEQKISVYPFHSSDEAFSVQTYSFQDKVPVGIYEDFMIDFEPIK